jgi:hypothetical protein
MAAGQGPVMTHDALLVLVGRCGCSAAGAGAFACLGGTFCRRSRGGLHRGGTRLGCLFCLRRRHLGPRSRQWCRPHHRRRRWFRSRLLRNARRRYGGRRSGTRRRGRDTWRHWCNARPRRRNARPDLPNLRGRTARHGNDARRSPVRPRHDRHRIAWQQRRSDAKDAAVPSIQQHAHFSSRAYRGHRIDHAAQNRPMQRSQSHRAHNRSGFKGRNQHHRRNGHHTGIDRRRRRQCLRQVAGLCGSVDGEQPRTKRDYPFHDNSPDSCVLRMVNDPSRIGQRLDARASSRSIIFAR